MSTFMSVFAHLVEHIADLLQPLFHGSAAAAAIVLFTALVRLLVHPLSRAAARGQRAQAALRPRIAELKKEHGKDREKFQKALMELHAEEKVSPLSGCLPSLLQMPAFFLLYHLFSSSTIGGGANTLLGHKLFAAPLGDRWADALGDGGLFGRPASSTWPSSPSSRPWPVSTTCARSGRPSSPRPRRVRPGASRRPLSPRSPRSCRSCPSSRCSPWLWCRWRPRCTW